MNKLNITLDGYNEEIMDCIIDQMHDYIIGKGYINDMYSFDYVKNIKCGVVTRVTWDDFIEACKLQYIYFISGGDNIEKLY